MNNHEIFDLPFFQAMMSQRSSHSSSISSLDYSDKTCSICGDSHDFRALKCGHCFCINCLTVLRNLNGTTIHCPLDRLTDDTEPELLPLPENFNGRVFIPSFDEHCSNDFVDLLCEQLATRKRTIEHLRFIATALSSMELKCAGAKIGGSATGIVGGVMAVIGLGLSLTGVGAIVGAPLGISGAVIAGTGGLATGITIIIENVLKKNGIDEIERHLQEDNFRSEQIKVLLGRAAQDSNFAKAWKINHQDAASFVALIPRALKVGLATAAGVRAAIAMSAGVARAAGTTGLHVAGLVFAAALIPIDLAQMIVSSIKIHHNRPSEIVQTIFNAADNLDVELKLFLVAGHYFQPIDCVDEDNNRRWVFLVISPRHIDTVMKDLRSNEPFAYEDVIKLGEVIEEGCGAKIPQRVIDKIDKNWYSLHRDYADASFHKEDRREIEEFEIIG